MEHALFGTKHIILIIASLALVAVGYFLARKLEFRKMTRLMLYIGIVSEAVKVFYYIVSNEEKMGGILPKNDLPFQLCSIQIIFILILNLTNNGRIHRFLTSFMIPSCLIGGLAALLIATHSSRNGMWIITAQYFIYHAAIMVYSLYLLTNKSTRPTLDGYFDCLKLLLVLMFFAIYINSMMYDGTSDFNFMYVVKPPQSGLPYLNDNEGWLVYILRYGLLVVGSVTLFYVKPIFLAIKAKFKKAPECEAEEIKEEETV